MGPFSLGFFALLLRPGEGVCRGLCLLAFHLLLPALAVSFCWVSFGLCAFLVVSLRCAAGFLFGFFGVWFVSRVAAVFCSLFGCFDFLLLVLGVVAVWPALSCCPLLPLPPLVGPLVPSGPVSVLLVPPSGYLVVSVTARLPYLWYGVLPCVGLCPLHHVVGVD